MWKELINIWKSDDLLIEAWDNSYEMLQLSREMFIQSVEMLKTKAKGKTLIALKKRDKEINEFQRDIRRKVMTHLVLQSDSTDIPNGGAYNFGACQVETSASITFTIENNGVGDLMLYGSPIINITGPDANEFKVVQQPISPVPSSDNTTFKIEFRPTSLNTKTAYISIANNDSVTSYAKLLNELGSYGYQEWSEWYAEFKGIPISRVDDEKLYNFWLSFDGDFEAMQKYVFANMEDEQKDLTDYFGA